MKEQRKVMKQQVKCAKKLRHICHDLGETHFAQLARAKSMMLLELSMAVDSSSGQVHSRISGRDSSNGGGDFGNVETGLSSGVGVVSNLGRSLNSVMWVDVTLKPSICSMALDLRKRDRASSSGGVDHGCKDAGSCGVGVDSGHTGCQAVAVGGVVFVRSRDNHE
ncbi:unnamed protein product [Discosporangium mesarthrocarpum]